MYVDAELITDETAAAEGFLAALADRMTSALGLEEGEEWEVQEGSPETSIGEAVGIFLATAMSMVQEQERNDYAGFGSLILRTPRLTAEPAEAIARWTFDTDALHNVPDGSELVVDAADGTPVAFATVGTVEFTGVYADIPVVAIEPGAVTNQLIGPARDWEPLPHVADVELVTESSGGRDEEGRTEYLDRIERRSRRMKLVPIITDDYADTALDHPAVGAAMAVRLYDLTNPTDPPSSGGHITVWVRGHSGEDLAPEAKAEVQASFMGTDRPLAVTTHIGDPPRTPVTIATAIRLTADADEAATIAAVQSAIETAYDPAVYGVDEDAPGRWRPARTVAERTINEYDVTALIDDLPGLAKIEDVTVNGGESVTLTGWAALPELTGPPEVTVLT